MTLLRNGREVLPQMLESIAGAREEILLEMYWIEADAVGLAFRDALCASARRGVNVRCILDGFGSARLPTSAFDEPLRKAGARVHRFHPLIASLGPFRLHRVLARDHRKLLVVDGRDAYIGGLNLCARWAPIAMGGDDWRDTAVRVEGPELPLHTKALIEGTWSRIQNHQRPERDPTNVWAAENGRIGILANTPEHRRGRKIRQAYLWGLRRAKHSVDIACAYFAPRPVFVRALSRAVDRGVRVRMLLPLKSDVWLADLLASSWVHALEDCGVELYGYTGSTLHAKTAVVDARWVTIGSHNLDALSWAYNLECNVFCDDPTFGQAAVAMFEDDLLLSVPLPKKDPRGITDDIADFLGAVMAAIYSRGI